MLHSSKFGSTPKSQIFNAKTRRLKEKSNLTFTCTNIFAGNSSRNHNKEIFQKIKLIEPRKWGKIEQGFLPRTFERIC